MLVTGRTDSIRSARSRDQCHGEDGQDGQSLVRLIDEGFGNIREFKGQIDPQHDAQHQERSPDRGENHISRMGIGLPRPSGKPGKEISSQDISRRQDDDKDSEGKK